MTGRLIAAGRSAEIYALDDHRVRRVYLTGADTAAEVEVMCYLRGHGYPVPEVSWAEGPEMIMERIVGGTMADELLGGRLSVGDAAATLIDLHDRLHDIPQRFGLDPSTRILHMDLHPYNVLFGPSGPVVIDWCNVRNGEPALDVAMTLIILAQVAVSGGSPLPMIADLVRALAAAAGPGPQAQLPRAAAIRADDPAMAGLDASVLQAAIDLIRDDLLP